MTTLTVGTILLTAFLLLSAGCGGKEVPSAGEPAAEEVAPDTAGAGEEKAPDPETGAVEGGESVTYTMDGSVVTYQVSQEAPPEEMLGVPVYPRAAYVPGSGGSVKGNAPEGEFATVGGEFRSADSFEAVYYWYRERLGDPTMCNPQQALATWNRAEGDRMVVVGIRREGGETVILIYSLQGNTELLTP